MLEGVGERRGLRDDDGGSVRGKAWVVIDVGGLCCCFF